MGNGIGKLTKCFTGETRRSKKSELSILEPDPLDEGLGHSFCYVRPDPTRVSSSKVHSEEETTTFRTISGASVSANAATPLSTSLYDPYGHIDRAAAFESTTSFSSIPLQPIPRSSGPIVPGSGPLERGFLSGPIERGFMSGPLDGSSGPIDGKTGSDQFQRSFSHGLANLRVGSRKGSLVRVLRRAISKTITRGQNSIVAPIKSVKEPDWVFGSDKTRIHQIENNLTVNSLNFSSEGSLLDDDVSLESQNLQWAQGKAGEDRVHVVVSEEHGWLFVGIYDGFNGPDAPDYLLSHLYPAVHRELKGLLWDDSKTDAKSSDEADVENRDSSSAKKSKNWEESQRRWRCEWDRDLDRLLKDRSNGSDLDPDPNSSDVLKALSQALRKTEEAYLENADMMLDENPELALMGSCVLVMLMKGEDVYLMNVGDSRAVLGQKAESEYWIGKIRQDLERINEETMNDFDGCCDGEGASLVPNLLAFQLTVDHSTNVEEEVDRIRKEHPDDASAVSNERVKGSLKVTRAFGAGFLKQPKWNNALLEMFQIDYKGTSPYINCLPSLYHHRLGSKDQFLILSSDGLYQYFTNEEAVSEVELFITLQPEGDPAQHLVQELLFRAAKKAGMDFHELLEIPQGERRRYHDDVSIVVISLEGRMWKSCV
ncbi:PPM-type phosphatase domain superfamily [Arabidopsis suecica]|uniref:protein-serine/threonine phosphatase n=1 Tax=Arabidopsis suecica TaxID=45249 RepID=A0A8T2AIY4_ARASU|nr:PPM-type phosphatase domain superfamily [Arabidopsis suecica]